MKGIDLMAHYRELPDVGISSKIEGSSGNLTSGADHEAVDKLLIGAKEHVAAAVNWNGIQSGG